MKYTSRFIYTIPGETVQRRYRAHRCVKCNNAKSPTWRLGPNGVTLCNKCGLKYRRELKLSKNPRESSSPSTSLPDYPYEYLLSSQEPSNSTPNISITRADLPGEILQSSDDTSSGSFTSEPSIWSLGSDEELDDPQEDEIGASLSIDGQNRINTDEWNLIPCDGDSGWDISENMSSSRHPNNSSLTQTCNDVDNSISIFPLHRFSVQTRPGESGLAPAQDGSAPFGDISQPSCIVDILSFSHNQEQVNDLDHCASLSPISPPQTFGVCETPHSQMILPPSEEPSNGAFESLSTSSSSVTGVPFAFPHNSSLSGRCASALLKCRRRRTARTPSPRPSSYCPHTGLNNQNSVCFDVQLQARCEAAPQASDRFLGVNIQEMTGPACIAPDNVNGIQCTCSLCLQKVFFGYDETMSTELVHYLDISINKFYRRAAATHYAALQDQSSVYVATESFICANAGDHLIVTVFAVLRQELELVQSNSGRYPALMAAGCDLVFDHVVTGTATYPTPLDDWLYGQSIMKHLSSERTKSAIWDMSRLPPGPHYPDSKSFRWLRRTLLAIQTSAGPQVVMNVQSGSDKHQFRRLHAVLALIKYVDIPHRLELYTSLEPEVLGACIQSCQEWFIAVLDESAKQPSHDLQLQFLEANKLYMLDCMEVYMLTFHGMNIYSCLHLCSPNCASHVQPSFQSLVDTARDALQNLFSPPESLLGYIHNKPSTYPTRNQLFLARLVGLTQFRFYFSYLLLTKERKTEHSITSRAGLANARLVLAERTQAKVIWNYLPVDVGRCAASKLARAMEAFESSPIVTVM